MVTGSTPFEVSNEIEIWKVSGQKLTESDDESSYRQKAWDVPHIELTKNHLLSNADQF